MINPMVGRKGLTPKGFPPAESTPHAPAFHSAKILLGVLALGVSFTYGKGLTIESLLSSSFQVPISNLSSDTVVNLGYASYRGLLDDITPDVISWLGVRYAQPPRRFRAPLPLDETPREHNITDADQYPPFCIQGYSPWVSPDDTGGAGSEDCLYINIYAPKGVTNTSALPVLTFIHGGGYFTGNPRSWSFENWVQRSPTPFVAVTIYYRLSIFGFLSAPEEPRKGVYSGEDPELVLNAGIHDQLLALKFIQRHIRSFGGDPHKVTIMGHSAGGGSVGLHLVARIANPEDRLFHRVIVQSWYRPPLLLPAARKEQWEAVIQLVGCSTNSSDVMHTIECLRTVNHVRLIQAADEGRRRHGGTLWAWLPVVDHTLLESNPASILKAIPGVDVMVGHTTADSSVAGISFEAAVNNKYPGLTVADIDTLKAMYVAARIPEENMATFGLGEAVFRCGTHFLADMYGTRAHTYRWDEPDPGRPTSAEHASDNYILYDGLLTLSNGSVSFHALTPAQRGLSDETIAYFTSFCANAVPKAANTSSTSHPLWPAHSSGKRIVFRAEGGGTGEVRGTPGASFLEELDRGEIERCKVWNSMATKAGM